MKYPCTSRNEKCFTLALFYVVQALFAAAATRWAHSAEHNNNAAKFIEKSTHTEQQHCIRSDRRLSSIAAAHHIIFGIAKFLLAFILFLSLRRLCLSSPHFFLFVYLRYNSLVNKRFIFKSFVLI